MPFVAFAAALVIVLCVIAISQRWITPQVFGAAKPGSEKNTILLLAGSNTIGDTLAPSLAEAFFRNQGASNVQVLPGAKPEEKIVQGVLPGDSSASSIKIAAHGSATAFVALAGNVCDIGMASRRIKPDEASKLASMGDFYSSGSEHVLGLDGIAVIVNASNPVGELSVDQIKRIFAGEITDWSQIGSSRGAIDIYARNDNSGTYDTFKSLVLAGSPLAASAHRFEDSNALSDAVSGDPNGIGFIGLPFVHNARAVAVSEKGTSALQPTRLTVATEDYALSRRLYLYTPANPRNKYARMFVEFALSKQGQDVVAANGFIAQSIVPESQTVSKDAPGEYQRLTWNAQRLPLDFRFQAGEAVQDNKAQADLDRVVSMIADQKNSGKKIMLFGFSDSTGSLQANQALSVDRAKAIENQFVQRGITPTVVRGFGANLPVASNDTAAGREKNRRVEIWIVG
jgi:phosphate transport system substrate-binding protein